MGHVIHMGQTAVSQHTIGVVYDLVLPIESFGTAIVLRLGKHLPTLCTELRAN